MPVPWPTLDRPQDCTAPYAPAAVPTDVGNALGRKVGELAVATLMN